MRMLCGACAVFDWRPALSHPSLGSGRVTGQWGSNVSARCVCGASGSPLPLAPFYIAIRLSATIQYIRFLLNPQTSQ